MFKTMNKSLSFFIVFSCMVLLVVTGCQHKKTKVVSRQDSFALQESIARLCDIPDGPVGFKVKEVEKDEGNSDNVRIEYKARKKEVVQLEDIKKLYSCNMELLGWNLTSIFDGQDELLMLFERPRGKKCIVSLRLDGCLIVTILGKKRDL
ncbi:MAG: hypothetical protein WC747_00725 [Candidatus Babeliales bacterium]|jgi:hypothetical protein